MSNNFKIKIKNVESFVKTETVSFASGEGKRFLIKLHAGPNVKRYIVRSPSDGIDEGFTNKSKAVRLFNSI